MNVSSVNVFSSDLRRGARKCVGYRALHRCLGIPPPQENEGKCVTAPVDGARSSMTPGQRRCSLPSVRVILSEATVRKYALMQVRAYDSVINSTFALYSDYLSEMKRPDPSLRETPSKRKAFFGNEI